MFRTTRSALLILAAASILASPAAQAGRWSDPYSFELRHDDSSDFFLPSSAYFLAHPGPSWLMNAMPGSHLSYLRSPNIYDRDGDRLDSIYRNASDVGTLANPYQTSPFNLTLFNNISGFSQGGAPKAVFPTLMDATGATIDWTGATSTSWTTGTNWVGGTPPANDLTSNIARFNQLIYANQPSTGGGTTNISGIEVGDGLTSTAGITISSAGGVFNIGSDGIKLFANAGTATFTGGTLNIGANQNWTNDSSSLLSISNTNLRNSNTTTPFKLTINGAGTGGTTINALIADSISGTGTFALEINTTGGVTTLSNNNTFTGGLTVTQGVLRATNAGALGLGTLTLAGGELQTAVGNTNYGSNVTVTGNAQITSDRTASSATGVTATFGTLSIGGQTLTIARGSNITGSGVGGVTFGSTSLTGSSIFSVGTNASLTLGALNDGGTARTIEKSGPGTLTLGTAATSLGNGTTINLTGGTLNSNVALALGDKANVVLSTGTTFNIGASQTIGALNSAAANTGTVTIGANTLTIGNTNNLNSTFDGIISGTNGIVAKSGTGTLTLTNSGNSYSGGTIINAGTLSATGTGQLGGGGITFNGGTLRLTGGSNTSKQVNLNSTGIIDISTGATFTWSGKFTGSGGLTKTGADNLTLTNSANDYLGATTVNQGILRIGTQSNTLPTGTNLIVNSGATFDLNALDQTVAQLNDGTGGGGTVLNQSAASNTLSTITVTGSGTFSGSIQNGTGTNRQVALTKSTGGTLTLTGTNTYTGATQVTGGTLLIGTGGSLASGSTVTVTNAGTVLGGTGTIGGKVTVGGGGTPGSGSVILAGSGANDANKFGTLTVSNTSSGAITLNSGSVIELALGGTSTTHSTLAHTGAGTISFASNQAFTFLDFGATAITYQDIITGTGLGSLDTSGWSITNPGWLGSFVLDGSGNIDVTFTAVPEPSTWIGAALAVAAIGFTQRRKLRGLISRA